MPGVRTVNRTPTYSEPQTPQANQPLYWERLGYGSCTKYDVDDDSGSVWELDALASALVLKAGTINDVWESPEAGLFGTASAKGISHVIVCAR